MAWVKSRKPFSTLMLDFALVSRNGIPCCLAIWQRWQQQLNNNNNKNINNNNNGCIHNQQSDQLDESDLLKFVHNQIQIWSDASVKNLTPMTDLKKLTPMTDFYKPCPGGMWHKRSNSQFKMANHRDWGIVGYNDAIVWVTVINIMNAFFFIGLDRCHLTNLIAWTVATINNTFAERHLTWLNSANEVN